MEVRILVVSGISLGKGSGEYIGVGEDGLTLGEVTRVQAQKELRRSTQLGYVNFTIYKSHLNRKQMISSTVYDSMISYEGGVLLAHACNPSYSGGRDQEIKV
jgi:hypothetical protein